MRTFGLRLIAGVCLILSVGVMANVLLLQHKGGPRSVALGTSQMSGAELGANGWPVTEAKIPQQPTRRLVRAIQRELADRNYFSGRPTGELTLVTRAAIMAFQADHGQALTGEADEAVLRAILLGASGEVGVATGQIGPEAQAVVRHVQDMLARAGFQDVKKSGLVDDETRQAIARFEARHELPPKGRISAELLTLLAAATRRS